MSSEIAAVDDESVTIERRIEDLEKLMNIVTNDCGTLFQRLSDLGDDVAAIEGDVNLATTDIQDLLQRMSKLESIAPESDELLILDSRIENLEERTDNISENMWNIDSQLADVESKVSDHEYVTEKNHEAIGALMSTDITDLLQRVSDLEEQLSDSSNDEDTDLYGLDEDAMDVDLVALVKEELDLYHHCNEYKRGMFNHVCIISGNTTHLAPEEVANIRDSPNWELYDITDSRVRITRIEE